MTNSKTPDLKPCPFCGGEAKYNEAKSYAANNGLHVIWHEIECLKCGANIHDGADFETAVKEWNARHNPAVDKIKAKIKTLDRRIDHANDKQTLALNNRIRGLEFALAALEGE